MNKSKLTAALIWWTKVGFALTLALSLSAVAGVDSYPWELGSSFRLQYFLLSLAGAGMFILLQERRWFGICAVITLLNAPAVLAWYSPVPSARASGLQSQYAKTKIRLMSANIYTPNERYEEFVKLVEETKPDVLVVIETDKEWVEGIKRIRETMPYSEAHESEDNFGMALYSKVPFALVENHSFGGFRRPTGVVDININGSAISVIGAHPPPPTLEQGFRIRSAYLQSLHQFIAKQNKKFVVLGDLNITAWSPIYRRFMDGLSLKSSRVGRGIMPTWPAPFPFLYIPIDHCLLDSSFDVLESYTLPIAGSDHLALVTDISPSIAE